MTEVGPFKSWPNLKYEDTIFFRLPDPYSYKTRSWFHESLNNKDTLLIVVGDSWTWGDSLSGISFYLNKVDDPNRINLIYGSLLSKKLNSDFINIAECGGSNHLMLTRLQSILEYNHFKYKKIYVVITLTENCRELNLDGSRNMWSKIIPKNFYDFLKLYEYNMFEDFKKLFDFYKNHDIMFLIGRNFTYSFDDNIKILENFHLDKTWMDCLSKNLKTKYPANVRFLSQIGIKPLENFIKNNNMYDEMASDMIKEFNLALTALDWLDNSPYNYKIFTKHPNELGHKIYANYLFETIKKREN